MSEILCAPYRASSLSVWDVMIAYRAPYVLFIIISYRAPHILFVTNKICLPCFFFYIIEKMFYRKKLFFGKKKLFTEQKILALQKGRILIAVLKTISR